MGTGKFKGVLFDLDGTLADNCVAITKGLKLSFESLGLGEFSPDLGKVREVIGGSILITIEKLLPEDRLGLAKRIGEKYMEIFPEVIFDGLAPMPFAEETLDSLKKLGLKLACFSNKQQSGVSKIMDKLGFSKYLDEAVGTELESFRKPDPRYTEFVLSKMGLSASEALMVGDSPYDYLAAKNAGMDSALVSTGSHSAEILSKECSGTLGVFSNLKELSNKIFF